jgi:hypothetical protein
MSIRFSKRTVPERDRCVSRAARDADEVRVLRDPLAVLSGDSLSLADVCHEGGSDPYNRVGQHARSRAINFRGH